jgi:hypothetical protein
VWQLPLTIPLGYVANVTLLIINLWMKRSGGIALTNFRNINKIGTFRIHFKYEIVKIIII